MSKQGWEELTRARGWKVVGGEDQVRCVLGFLGRSNPRFPEPRF